MSNYFLIMLQIKLPLEWQKKTRISCKELLENAVDANASDIKPTKQRSR
jgi:hypothetical protein